MKILILMGSPRHDGNTAELAKSFMEELKAMREFEDIIVQYITVSDKAIAPCMNCGVCQQTPGIYGCAHQDDMWQLTGQMLWADLIVLATPIYTWFCPAELKAMLDRLYGMNKYSVTAASGVAGQTADTDPAEHAAQNINKSLTEQNPQPYFLLAGRGLALLATHGDDRAAATEPFEEAIRRYCAHTHLDYYGMYSVQTTDGKASCQTEEAVSGAKNFATGLVLEWMNRQEG